MLQSSLSSKCGNIAIKTCFHIAWPTKNVALAGQKHLRNEYNPIKIIFDLKMINVSNSQGNVETRLYSHVSTF